MRKLTIRETVSLLKRKPLLRSLFLCLASLSSAVAQSPASRIVAPVDEATLVTMTGSTHPLARVAFDQGVLADSTALNRMQLVLQRSPEQEAALKQLLDRQQDRGSSSFHQWLTPQSFGAAFGASDRDLSTVTAWLAAQGFTGIRINAGRTVVEFSGTAGTVQNAFHTVMHRYLMNGQPFLSNASDPQIPAALAPVIAGVASLNNFAGQPPTVTPVPLMRDNKTGIVTRSTVLPTTATTDAASFAVHVDYTTPSSTGQPIYAVTPADLATIYNFAQLLNGTTPINGKGQSIAIVSDSDINAADFLSFRNLFALPIGSTSSPTHTQYLNIIFNGNDPGTYPDEIKGDAETQWASAVAPYATIDYVVSETTSVSQGSDLSAQYIVDNDLAPVLVDTFTHCESNAGNPYNLFISNLWQQAAAQGISVVVAAGDNGSAGCDTVGTSAASGGLSVNAIASTPYNVAVGGTDLTGGWTTNNSANHASALGYLIETTWNDNLGPQAMGAIVRGGSGGASSCAVASGTSCAGYPKPSWQTGVNGIPSDGVRDLPDLSLFAGDGAYGALYFVCQQDAVPPPGTACTLGTPTTNFVGAGGTSFSAAAFAGMLALLNQATGTGQPGAPYGQGNPNQTLYVLAAKQQQAATTCAANHPPSASCIFNDITTGNNEMPCATGSPDCSSTGPNGPVLSSYASTPGYDLATGLGSINVQNLVNQWPTVTYNATATALTLSANGSTTGGGNSTPLTIVHGTPVTAAGSVTANSGTPTGQVAINSNAANGSIGTIPLANGDFNQPFATFPGSADPTTGTLVSYQVRAYYGGDANFAYSQSIPVNLIVTPEPDTTTVSVIDVTNGKNQVVTSVAYGEFLDVQAAVVGASRQGIATGNIKLTDNGNPLYGGIFPLNSSSTTVSQTTALDVATSPHKFVASYAGDPSFAASASASYTLNITRAPNTTSATPSTLNTPDNLTVAFNISIGTIGYGDIAPTGSITLTSSSGKLLGTVPAIGKTGIGLYDSSSATIAIPAALIPTGDTVTANYPGDSNYVPSSAVTGAITITPTYLPTTATTLTVNPNPVAPTGTATLTATVAQATGKPANFTGAVNFFIDGQLVAAGVPAGATTGIATVTLPVAASPIGPNTAVVVFLGDSTHKSSTSTPPTPFTISNATGNTQSATVATVLPKVVVQGTAIVVSAAVTPATTAPTGTVQLIIDGNFNGLPITLNSTGAGSFTLVTSVLLPGNHTALVYYAGDATYTPSYSAPVAFTITAAGNTPTTIAISDVAPLVGLGVTVPFTATITPSSPMPTGTTELILDGGTPQAQVPLPTADPATLQLNTTGLSLGSHTAAVYYSGNTSLTAATSNTLSFTLIPQSSSFTLSPTIASAQIPIEGSASNPTTLTVTPTVGGTFSVSFACTSGLPQNVTCSFTPATVTVSGIATATTNLTFVVGSYPQASLDKPSIPGGWYTLGGGLSFAGLFLLLLPRRNCRFASLLAVLTFFALGAATGCGSGIGPQQGPFPVVVTATSSISVLGPATQTATINLTIGGPLLERNDSPSLPLTAGARKRNTLQP
jgi:subtilase family serine protease